LLLPSIGVNFGCLFNAIAHALMTISLKETFVSGMLLIIALDFMASSITSIVVVMRRSE
jgi:hypothetical protein